ncbi:uncharacterized protein LTR77_003167 [Saxophila tyrrhenica]|uniref:Uncharacterized protein n=1 Tax=Saxophila tyrrhenica TaxID=1690608 RepID=A0AAV9PK85_9PEZI|nr:hypothetical protein LTR77_003167 [Saxophila tyrrhenica]
MEFSFLLAVRELTADHTTAASFQPETCINIFDFVIAAVDVATGVASTVGSSGRADCSSHGSSSSFYIIEQKLPRPPPFRCYIYNITIIGGTCTQEQYDALAYRTAVVEDLYVVEPSGGSPGAVA